MDLISKNPDKSIKPLSLNMVIISSVFVLLQSCYCEQIGYTVYDQNDQLVQKNYETCNFPILGVLHQLSFGPPPPKNTSNSGNVKSNSTSARKLKVIALPTRGEYLTTTITAGPSLNFKSSNEEYGGGYGKHKPGIGFHIGVGTVFPFSEQWAVASALRFTQKNASEELGYSEPGAGGSIKFKDNYSYNYIGGTLLAQYRAGKQLSFVAGPEVNFLVSSSVTYGRSNGISKKESLNKSSQKIGLDLLAGIKYELPAKNNRSKWGLQLMYDHRLSRLNKKKDDTGMSVPAYKMRGLQLGVAYSICGCHKKK